MRIVIIEKSIFTFIFLSWLWFPVIIFITVRILLNQKIMLYFFWLGLLWCFFNWNKFLNSKLVVVLCLLKWLLSCISMNMVIIVWSHTCISLCGSTFNIWAFWSLILLEIFFLVNIFGIQHVLESFYEKIVLSRLQIKLKYHVDHASRVLKAPIFWKFYFLQKPLLFINCDIGATMTWKFS